LLSHPKAPILVQNTAQPEQPRTDVPHNLDKPARAFQPKTPPPKAPPKMFYQPSKTDHNLPFDPFKACVVPRPIGWISTVSATHQTKSEPTANLAPYSQFQNLTFDPPYVMFSANQTPDGTRKDSVVNAEATGIFCWQLATYPLRDAVNVTSEQLPYGVDEFERAGLKRTYSTTLTPKNPVPGFRGVPMVKDSPVRFECEYHSTIRLPGNPPVGTADIVIGKVVGVYIADGVINVETGKVDVAKTQPIARCGYYDYAVVRECFEMKMPGDQIMRDGLEGSSAKTRESNAKKNGGNVQNPETGLGGEEQHWSGSGAPSTFGADAYYDSHANYDAETVARNTAASTNNGEAKNPETGVTLQDQHWHGRGAPSTFGAEAYAYAISLDNHGKSAQNANQATKNNAPVKDIQTSAQPTPEEQHWRGSGAPSTFGADACYDSHASYDSVAQIIRDSLSSSSSNNNNKEKVKTGLTAEEQHWNGRGAPSTFGATA